MFFSDNGGFTFTQLNAVGPREGEAKSVEARANFKELGWTEQDWSAGAWWRDVGAGYSISRYDTGLDVTEVRCGNAGPVHADARHRMPATAGPSAAPSARPRPSSPPNGASTTHNTLSGEIRRVEQTSALGGCAGTLGAVKYTHRFGTSLDLYGTRAITLDDDGGQYADNDAFTLGGKYLFGDLSTVGAEVTTGDRGDAARSMPSTA